MFNQQLLWLWITVIVISTAQDLTCNVPGMCTGIFVYTSDTRTYNLCLERCGENSFCRWITFNEESKECIEFYDCPGFDDECVTCYSGQVDCPPTEPVCDVPGVCHGHLLTSKDTETSAECLEFCHTVEDCRWYSYFVDSRNCVLTEDCVIFDDVSCTNCVTGERECRIERATWTKLMIISSFPLFSDVEVIDLSPDNRTCQKPPDTFGGQGQVGNFIEGRPMTCGGNYDGGHDKCYSYAKEDNSWLPAAPTTDNRYGAAGVLMNDTAWWVVGGSQLSSEIYTADVGWSEYLDLPKRDQGFCLLKVNDTHYFLVGGNVDGDKAYLFETSSDTWTPLRDASEDRGFLPTCGVITRVSGEKEVVLAGGHNGSQYLRSSEIFSFSTMSWRSGPDLPSQMNAAFGVSFGSTFIAVGGSDVSSRYDTILRYDEVDDGWEILPQRLPSARGVYLAFMVPDDAVDCT